MAEVDDLKDALGTLKSDIVRGSALVDREGDMIYSDLPPGINQGTFSIMCATMMGAARTANSEMGDSPIQKLAFNSKDGTILLTDAGKKELLVVVADSGINPDKLFRNIRKDLRKIKKR